MADEITVSASLRVTNGNFTMSQNPGSKTFDQTLGRGGNPGSVNIGTSDEAIALGDITTPGWAYFQNLDVTNYVEIGPEDTGAMVPFMRLEAGEIAVLRLSPTVTLRGLANTAAVNVQIMVLED